MPRKKYWRKAEKKRRTDWTEDCKLAGLIKNSTEDIDVTEDALDSNAAGLIKNSTEDFTKDRTEDANFAGLVKNSSNDTQLRKESIYLESQLRKESIYLESQLRKESIIPESQLRKESIIPESQLRKESIIPESQVHNGIEIFENDICLESELCTCTDNECLLCGHSISAPCKTNDNCKPQPYIGNTKQSANQTDTNSKKQNTNNFNKINNAERTKGACDLMTRHNEQAAIHRDKTIWASISQSDVAFSDISRGRQCTCNALVMLLYSIHKKEFTTNVLDEVLRKGDELYHTVLYDLISSGKFREYLLQFEELPANITLSPHSYAVSKENVLLGTIVELPNLPFSQTLHTAINTMLHQTGMGLIIAGAVCSAIFRDFEGRFAFFDSHSHGQNSLSDSGGTALLKFFNSIDDLLTYLYAFYDSLGIGFDFRFEVQPLAVQLANIPSVEQLHHVDPENHDRLLRYFKYQKDMTDKQSRCHTEMSEKNQNAKQQKRDYNRDYKQKQRLQSAFREQEKENQLETKKKSRANETFRQNEREHELEAKKKSRANETFRQNEATAKKRVRLDEGYRQKERELELEAKKKSRTNEMFRQKEREHELEAKKKSRTNETFRQKEREHDVGARKKCRANETFRQKEREHELEAKKKSRTNETFRQKEREHELEAKRKLRVNEIFRQKECSRNVLSKQTARNSKYFQEKERLAKQSSRLDKNQRSKERVRDMDIKRDHRQELATHQYTKDESLQGIKDATIQFHKAIATGPIYVCTCCHQTWFRHSVVQVSKTRLFSAPIHQDYEQYLTSCTSKNEKEFICKTCQSTIQKGKVPPLSVANKMSFTNKPQELNLHQLEERLVALRIPFMQVRELPRGGQLSIRGNVVNVPVDIQPTIKALPRQLEDTTIPVRLKRKMVYNKCEFTENVRPAHVVSALHWLLRNSDLYKNSGIEIDQEWLSQMTNQANDIVKSFTDIACDEMCEKHNDDEGSDSDAFSEVDDKEMMVGNADTLIVEACPQNDSTYTFAPGEGQHPLSLYSDTDSEYLSFPTIFCGQRRADNSERKVKVHYSDIAKWELRNVDRRAANSVPNIFYKLKKIQMKQISDKVNLSLRRCKNNDKKVTAAQALNPVQMNKLVNLDEGFYIFRTLRNSPPYLEKRKKDVFAMIRQLGLPTWFSSLSAGDTRWHDLLRMLGELNDNKSYTDEEIEKMSWNDKTRLVQKDPVTCARYFDHRVQQFITLILKSKHDPIGKLKDYFYRVEFQNRGSPHIHMLIWIEDAPKYKVNENEEIAEYVDKYTSCQKDVDDSVSPLVGIQTHKHSKTCRKKGKPVCRFGFPFPPMAKTMILEPLDDDSTSYKQMYADIQTRLNNCTDLDKMTYDDFLKDVVETSEEEYIKCIRSSLMSPKVFLKRKPSEVRINPYMSILLTTWKANHDLQFVLDPYACAVYIVTYISKSQRGMSTLLDEACKEARKGNMDIKRQVRHMGNKFLNSVEISAQEACYLVLQMPLTKASREVVFINTSASADRIFLLKQKEALEDLPPESTDIEADNVIKRYSKRPKQLAKMCLADYVSQLDIKYPKSNKQTEEINDDDPLLSSESESEDEEIDMSENWTKITLKNGVVIKHRKIQKVIRYVRYNIKTDSENHFREKLLLFLPWRNEDTDLLGGFNTYEDHYNHVKPSVCDTISHYEHYSNELDLALQHAESDLSEQFDNIAPMTQHTEEEDYDEGSHESEKFVYYKPVSGQHKDYDIGTDLGISCNIPHVETTSTILPNDEYLRLVGKLNLKQREFFIHVLHWIKTNDEPLYAFLTGGAGVGKSLVITVLYQALRRYLCSFEGENPDDCKILLCAPTGKAAYNIGGTTIHAAFKIRPNQGYGTYTVDSDTLNTLRVKYKNLSVVIIDEVSMVGNKMLLLVNECLQRIKGNQNLFGGVSVILIGDLYQLKPVMDKWIFEDLNEQMGPLATNLWKSLFAMHELTEIMRQKDDKDFAELLNRLRTLENDKLSDADLKCLESRVVKPDDANYPLTAPHLFTTNAQVDSFNHKMFNNAEMEKVIIPSLDTVVGDLQAAVKERLLKALPQNVSNWST